MNQISIIIITYNRPYDLLELLGGLSQLQNLELLKDIIILNNNSIDDYTTVEAFISRNKFIPFRYIKSSENLGVARGRNYATKQALGNILLYLDDDTKIKDTHILQKVVNSFDKMNDDNREVGVVSYKVIYDLTGKVQVNAFPHKNYDEYKDKHQFETYYYAGCAHAKLKKAVIEAGPYPEDFFYGMEEYDFSYRVLNAGYCITYDDSVIIYHKESPQGRSPKAIKLKMMWVNKSKVAWRYLPKIFFYTTAIMWSLEFLLKSKFNFKIFAEGYKEVLLIRKTEHRSSISNATYQYLKKVKARLWY